MCILLVLYTWNGNPGHLVWCVTLTLICIRCKWRQNHQLQLFRPKVWLLLIIFWPQNQWRSTKSLPQWRKNHQSSCDDCSVWVWKRCKVQYQSMTMTFHPVSLIKLSERSSSCHWRHEWGYHHRITKNGWVSSQRNDEKFKLQVWYFPLFPKIE